MTIFNGKPKQEERFDKSFFTIFDSKSGTYKEPALARNQLEVLRDMENLFKNPEQARNMLVTNSEDFSVFKVAEYDDSTGEVRPISPIQHIANLHDIRTAVQKLGIVPT